MILVIRNFAKYHPTHKKEYPWRRLYCKEEGSFAALHWHTKALAALLLKACDEDGRIKCGDMDPALVIGRLIGASGHERRYLGRHIDALIHDGYLVVTEEQTGSKPDTNESKPVANQYQTGSKQEQTGSKRLGTVENHKGENAHIRVDKKREKRVRADRAQSGDHQVLIAKIDELYREANGGAKHGWNGKQGKIVQRLLKAHGLADCLARAEVLFGAGCPDWIARGGRDVGTLEAQWSKLAPQTGLFGRDPTVVRLEQMADDLEGGNDEG